MIALILTPVTLFLWSLWAAVYAAWQVSDYLAGRITEHVLGRV